MKEANESWTYRTWEKHRYNNIKAQRVSIAGTCREIGRKKNDKLSDAENK